MKLAFDNQERFNLVLSEKNIQKSIPLKTSEIKIYWGKHLLQEIKCVY